MTLIYVIYLGYASFFKIFGTKVLEIFNESVFVLIQYHLILLHNLVWLEPIREAIGSVIIFLTSVLLAINFFIIITVSIKPYARKLYLKYLKKKALKRHEEIKKMKIRTL